MSKYTSLFICGFRCTGKSTVSPLVAQKLGWRHIEMDDEISKITGKSIDELTQKGTDWQSFRQIEYDLLKRLLEEKNIVVSTGGGLGVNNVIKHDTEISFGRMEMNLFSSYPQSLVVVLNASLHMIRSRIVRQEMKKEESKRPLLNPQKAKKIFLLLDKFKDDPQKQKAVLVDMIADDSLQIYRQRIPLYEFLSIHHIDTGKLNVTQTIEQIVQKIKYI